MIHVNTIPAIFFEAQIVRPGPFCRQKGVLDLFPILVFEFSFLLFPQFLLQNQKLANVEGVDFIMRPLWPLI